MGDAFLIFCAYTARECGSDWQKGLAYRGNFLIRFFVMFLSDLLFPLVTLLVYRSGAAFPGWSLEEVLLIQGIFMMAKGLRQPVLFGLVWNIGQMVRGWPFDLMLIKPCSVIHLARHQFLPG